MTIFITGATGFVGRNFLEWVLQRQPDAKIICLVRDPQKAESQWAEKPANLQWLAGDLLEPASFKDALQEAAFVFHAAALVSLKNGPEFYRMNTDATQNLVELLKSSPKLKRLVFVSSISAIDRPMDRPAVEPLTEESPAHPNTDYGKSKLMAEELVAKSGLPYAILRPAYIYGPHPRINSSMDKLIRQVAAGEPYTRFPFPGLISGVHVADLAAMMWLAAQHPQAENQSFFVSNPQPVRASDAFAALAEALEAPFAPRPIDPEKLFRYRRTWYRKQPESLILRILFENFFACAPDKWYRLTDFQPTYDYQAGLAQTVGWYREHGLIDPSATLLNNSTSSRVQQV